MDNQPTTLVLLGITGDLAQKKILPALHDLFIRGKLPPQMRIVGFSRRPFSETEIREFVRPLLSHGEMVEEFLNTISYVQGNFDELESYQKLAAHLEAFDTARGMCSNKLFYLSVPPTLYENITTHISASGLSIPCGGDKGFARILIEKPFGNDVKTAERLDELLGKLFKEEQIFRIDHYLAKESLLDIMQRRQYDASFERKWNREHIASVEINLFETAVVGSRGPFYDPVGAFRDVGQNHILQMLALVAMEIPTHLSAKNIQAARAEVLSHIKPFSENDVPFVTRGQYVGYLAEPGVAADSDTETFFRLPVYINTPRFEGVPFMLSSGKALKESLTEIVVHFKDGSYKAFTVSGRDSLPAYQKILLDCIVGDQTIFTSTAEVLAEWNFVTPVVEKWKGGKLVQYEKGSDSKKIK